MAPYLAYIAFSDTSQLGCGDASLWPYEVEVQATHLTFASVCVVGVEGASRVFL